MGQGSYTNRWEVEMTYALLRHIIRQREYCSIDIAVLTPYTGQLQKLRSGFQKEFEIVLGERDEVLDNEDSPIMMTPVENTLAPTAVSPAKEVL